MKKTLVTTVDACTDAMVGFKGFNPDTSQTMICGGATRGWIIDLASAETLHDKCAAYPSVACRVLNVETSVIPGVASASNTPVTISNGGTVGFDAFLVISGTVQVRSQSFTINRRTSTASWSHPTYNWVCDYIIRERILWGSTIVSGSQASNSFCGSRLISETVTSNRVNISFSSGTYTSTFNIITPSLVGMQVGTPEMVVLRTYNPGQKALSVATESQIEVGFSYNIELANWSEGLNQVSWGLGTYTGIPANYSVICPSGCVVQEIANSSSILQSASIVVKKDYCKNGTYYSSIENLPGTTLSSTLAQTCQ